MKLVDFLNEKRITIKQFSVLIGYVDQYVKRVAQGKTKPSKQIIACIEHFTGNEVTGKDLLEVYYEHQNISPDESNEQFHTFFS